MGCFLAFFSNSRCYDTEESFEKWHEACTMRRSTMCGNVLCAYTDLFNMKINYSIALPVCQSGLTYIIFFTGKVKFICVSC